MIARKKNEVKQIRLLETASHSTIRDFQKMILLGHGIIFSQTNF